MGFAIPETYFALAIYQVKSDHTKNFGNDQVGIRPSWDWKACYPG